MNLLLRAAVPLSLLALSAAASDWPEFAGSHCKNMVSGEKNLPESFVPGEKDSVKGQISLGAPIYATPVVADGVLYVSSSSYLWAVYR